MVFFFSIKHPFWLAPNIAGVHNKQLQLQRHSSSQGLSSLKAEDEHRLYGCWFGTDQSKEADCDLNGIILPENKNVKIWFKKHLEIILT